MSEDLGSNQLVRKLLDEAAAHGRRIAEATGDMKPDQGRIASEKAAISAVIAAEHEGPIDPHNRQPDAVTVNVLTDAEDTAQRAEANHEYKSRDFWKAESEVPAAEPPPKPSMYVIVGGTVALGTTFAASIFDLGYVSDLDDSELRFMVAATIGLFIAWTCIASLFNVSEHDRETSAVKPQKTPNHWSVIAGICVVVAFACIRFSTSGEDWLLTIGLMCLDAGLLGYTKFCSGQHRHALDVWAERNDGRIHGLKRVADAKAELDAARKSLEYAQEGLRVAAQRRDSRLRRNFDLSAVQHAAMAAFQQAYYEGLDRNRDPRRGEIHAA